MPKRPDYVFLVVDIYSHALLGVFPDEDSARLASDNTAAACVVYRVAAKTCE